MTRKIYPILITLFLIYFAIAVYGAYRNCEDENGTLVRGLFWFECVSPATPEEV